MALLQSIFMKGVYEMRTLGSVLLILVLALFGFGFSLAHNLTQAQELATTRQQLAALQAQNQQLQLRYQQLELQRQQLSGQVQGLSSENANLQARINDLEMERTALAAQIDTYQNRLAILEQAHPLIRWLTNSPSGWVASLIVLPGLPLSFGAIYIFKARNRSTKSHPPSPDRANQVQALLTPEECHLIAKHRRECQPGTDGKPGEGFSSTPSSGKDRA